MSGVPHLWFNLSLRHEYWAGASVSNWINVIPSPISMGLGVHVRRVGEFFAVISRSPLAKNFIHGLVIEPTDPQFTTYTAPWPSDHSPFGNLPDGPKPRFISPSPDHPRPVYQLELPTTLRRESITQPLTIEYPTRKVYWRYILSGINQIPPPTVSPADSNIKFVEVREPTFNQEGSRALCFISDRPIPMTRTSPLRIRMGGSGRLQGQVLPNPRCRPSRVTLTQEIVRSLQAPIERNNLSPAGADPSAKDWIYCQDIFVAL